MSVYFLVEMSVKDQDMYNEYINKVEPIIKKYKGNYLARGGKIIPFSENWNPERIIIIEFPSVELVKLCLNSSEYKEISFLREESTISKAIVVEGISS